MFSKKSMVLSDPENTSNKKAVLTLQEVQNGLEGTLRLYNFPIEIDGICSLGIYVEKKVYKAGLTRKSHMFYDFFVDLPSIPNNFSVAVVNFQNAVAKPVLYGSSEGSGEDVYGSIISTLSGQKLTVEKTEEILNSHGLDFDEEEKKDIEKEIDAAICEGNCANCAYKKFFFENQEQKEEVYQTKNIVAESVEQRNFECSNDDEFDFTASTNSFGQMKSDEKKMFEKTETPLFEKKQDIFFDRLKPQIDKLFENNPTETNLQSLIPSSKWVRVEYENDGDFYVFGLLYDENEQVKYVCYGVPAVFEQEAPKELSGFPIWLPLGEEKGFGYWMTYQDAATGEPVKAIID